MLDKLEQLPLQESHLILLLGLFQGLSSILSILTKLILNLS